MSLNRVGILFNFLAGILLAPDIFGEERLIKWEKDLKELRKKLSDLFPKNKDMPRYGNLISILIGLFLLAFFISFLLTPYRLWSASESTIIFLKTMFGNEYSREFRWFTILFVLIFIWSLFKMLVEFERLSWDERELFSFSKLVKYVVLYLVSAIGFAYPSVSYLILFVIFAPLVLEWVGIGLFAILLGFSGMALDFLNRALSHKRGLRGIFTISGVTSFILGNILQFLDG